MNRNKGSAIIEITIMVPIIFGCIYFYIMSMLYIMEHGKVADGLSRQLYTVSSETVKANSTLPAPAKVNTPSTDLTNAEDEEFGTVQKEGGTEIIRYSGIFEKYNIEMELKKNGDNAVKNLRRWQFIADTVR